jgi:hypothetical protein
LPLVCLNPYPLYFIKANVIVAPVVEAGCFRIGVTGHALCDSNAAVVFQVIGNALATARAVVAQRVSFATMRPPI